MANNRSSAHPIPSDFSSVLQTNFQQLNSLPTFNIDFLDKDQDWYLLCFLQEQQRNGHSLEITFSALNSIVGALSEQSSFFNPVNNSISYLNQNHHILGESASNKSSICHEVSLALQCVNQLFPGRYSSSNQRSNNHSNTDDINTQSGNKNKTKSNNDDYSMVISNITEVGLVMNLSKINTLLLHPDGDVALNKLGYYEQGRNETSAGVSIFCDASDGIRGGFIRGTGVSIIKINRPVAHFSMFIASTGTKIASMLQRFYETNIQDGVYGRVFFTWSQSISDLPKIKSKSFTNVPSFSHFAYAVAYFFTNEYQFRYLAHETDFVDTNTEYMEFEERLMFEREKQDVDTPATYSVALNNHNIRTRGVANNQNDHDEGDSAFKFFKTLIDDWWKSSNSSEQHLKAIRRKVINMLSKCIWSMKIIRIIFQLMSKNLKTIDQKQGDRATSSSTSIDITFQQAIQASIKTYLSNECQQIENNKWIMWSNKTDIIVGYNWYLRKMLVVETLLTLKSLPDVVVQRLGKKSIDKNQEEIKLEKAMIKVMNFSVVFFTRQYLTNNNKGAGSGQFSHSNDLKPDQILSPLIENGLIIGGSFIKYARYKNEDLKYSSFCKQLPAVIQNTPRIKKAFEDLGLNMSHYETTFEHQHLPLSTEFTGEAIDFMKKKDEFVRYYHNYYKDDVHLQPFRKMVDERIRLGQIIKHEDKMHSSGQSYINSHQNENIDNNIFQLSNTSTESSIVKTNGHATSNLNQTNYKIMSPSSSSKNLSSQQVRASREDTIANFEQPNNIDMDDRTEQEQSISTSANLSENNDLSLQSPLSNETSHSLHNNIITKSLGKDSTSNTSVNDPRNSESDPVECLPETTSSQNQNLLCQGSSSSPLVPVASSTATTALSDIADALSAATSDEDQLPMDLVHIFNDQQVDPKVIVSERSKDTAINCSMSDAEESTTSEITFSGVNSLNNITNNIELLRTGSDEQDHQKTKKRGRPNSANSTSQKWSIEDVDDLIINPESSGAIWKSILIKRQFILGTSTTLFNMIPCKLFDETSRFKLIDFLVQKKILVKGYWFCDTKGASIVGYMKGSPADPDVAMALGNFGIDIEEYKRSLNPQHDIKRHLDGKLINKSYLFSSHLQEHIKNDEWLKENLEIDEGFIYVAKELLQTTSNYQIDEFQKQQKDKLQKATTNKRKKTEELQKETALISGTDIPIKRKRKPKTRED